VKDPTIPTPEERKKFMFYDSGKRQTDLKIRLRTDNLNQSMFFRMMITGYLERDEDLVAFIEKFKSKNKLDGRSFSNKITKSAHKAKDTRSQFGLDNDDIENFFDIMEEEHPDL
jgi:hypothetical protein